MSKSMKIGAVVAGCAFFGAAMELRECFASVWIRAGIAGIGAAALGIAIVFANTSIERPKALLRRASLWGSVASAFTVAVVVVLALMHMVANKGTVKIELSDPNAKVELKIDGKQIDVAGLTDPLRLSAGEHVLEVASADFETSTTSFRIRRREQAIVKVTLVAREPGAWSDIRRER